MTAFLIANMAPLMFGALVVFLLLGYPVAFSLAANGLFFGLIAIDLGLLQPQLLQALPERVFGIMRNDTLLAIPFFTFMGLILERSGMAEDLLETVGQLFGPLRGGLAYAVIFVGALLAATTGVVAASVISMGLISLPIMLRYGYDRRLASGVIAASGTLGRRHVRRRDLSGPRPHRAVRGLCSCHHAAVSQIGAGAAGRSAPAARLEACRPRALRADPAARAHLPSAGNHLPRHCDADRGRRDGRHRRAGAGAHQPAPELGAAQAGHELDRQADFVRGVHPGRRDRIQPHVPRRERRPVGRDLL